MSDHPSSKKKVSVRHKEHDELRLFLRLAFCGLVLRGFDRERDIKDPILRKAWRLGKRINREAK